MKNGLGLLIAATVIFTAAFACNVSTANMSSFTITSDKAGTKEKTTFKSGETIYGNATISNSMDDVKVKMQLVADDAPGMTKGEVLKGSDATVDLPSSGVATFTLTIPSGFKGGKFIATADMIDKNGEKKDSKSVNVTITGDSGSTSTSDSKPDNKDDDK